MPYRKGELVPHTDNDWMLLRFVVGLQLDAEAEAPDSRAAPFARSVRAECAGMMDRSIL
jgi:hypothetical protein